MNDLVGNALVKNVLYCGGVDVDDVNDAEKSNFEL